MNGLENISRKSETDHTIIQTEAGQIIPAEEETWKQIWTRKGRAEGGIEDLLAFDGYERTQVDMKEVAAEISRRLDIRMRRRSAGPVSGLRLYGHRLFPYTRQTPHRAAAQSGFGRRGRQSAV